MPTARGLGLRARRVSHWCRLLGLCGAVTLGPGTRASDVSHLEVLATLDAVSGREAEARRYIQGRAGGEQIVDNTGSLTVMFGSGSPHTLIVAGLDEPGYVVSRIDDQGYLRLHRLADPSPHHQFESFFAGQPVRVTIAEGRTLPGVVGARSVHLDDQRPYGSRSARDTGLFVDIGASSRQQAAAAGVAVLQPVSFVKRFVRLGKGSRITAPWISSRAGAAILLGLAETMKRTPPPGRVTLGFVTQQFYYQAGLVRVLQRVDPDRVVLLRPGGNAAPELAPVEGWSSELADELQKLADKRGFGFARASADGLSFGPFAANDVWKEPQQSAVLTLGVENAGTPVEVVDRKRLSQTAALLGALCGLPSGNQEQAGQQPRDRRRHAAAEKPRQESGLKKDPLTELLAQLVTLPGVSGSEGPVRTFIQEQLPQWAKKRSRVDDKGNLVVRLGRDAAPRAVFVAHMDEIGFKVQRIRSDGKLDVEPVGGLLEDLFAWRPVVVHGKGGPVNGVMTREEAVDIGAQSDSEVEEMGVAVGDTVTVTKRMQRLLGSRATGRSFDDRIGCAVLLSVLRSMRPQRMPAITAGAPVWLVFGVEEEIGLVGAEHLARHHAAERVYAVDSFVTSDSPVEDQRIAMAPLGEGFVIRALDSSGMTPADAVERVARLARRRGIPMQLGLTSGGNDGSRFVRYGGVNVPLSWPLRYAHTAAEVADLEDVRALEQIVGALVAQELAN